MKNYWLKVKSSRGPTNSNPKWEPFELSRITVGCDPGTPAGRDASQGRLLLTADA